MAIQALKYTINGVVPLLMANPQTVDKFNPIAREMAKINAKKTRRTDADYEDLRDLEMKAKVYWNDTLGIFIPTRWITASICKISHAQAKISKAVIRGSVFTSENEVKLHYRGEESVKGVEDVIKNAAFRHQMILPQGQVRIAKTMPIFHNWSFSGELEFDDKVIDPATLESLIDYGAHYGGFGDFRPTFGRAEAEVTHV